MIRNTEGNYAPTRDDAPVAIEHGMSVALAPVFKGVAGWRVAPDVLERLGKVLLSGTPTSLSDAAKQGNCSRDTVVRMHAVLNSERKRRGQGPILCPCGKPLTHDGRCSHRVHRVRVYKDRPSVFDETVEKWQGRRSEYDRLGASVTAAPLVKEFLQDLEYLASHASIDRRKSDETPLTYAQASALGGYSVDRLTVLVATGKIKNVGRKGRPRIRRCDVPIKPSHVGHAA